MENGNILIGAGDGTVDMVQEKKVNLREPHSIAYKLPSQPELLVVSKSINANT